jgi:hydrogenase maturation protein HypF
VDVAGVRQRRRLVVQGVVQGVGFRPYVARLAVDLGLGGRCRNDSTCVVVEVEGAAEAVGRFAVRLVEEAPPLARIMRLTSSPLPTTGDEVFAIEHSSSGNGARTMVPPDAATCADCVRELFDPADRRYRHPFITCTSCGPRFTITEDLPYDRAATTMRGFAMCEACAREYADPADRRHHAQPIACHDCGPTLAMSRADGTRLAAGTEPVLAAAADVLAAGEILAVKGLGGYHLVCDATSDTAVARLRRRKQRPDRPFALMGGDLDVLGRLVEVPDGAVPALTGPEHAIVLLPRLPGAPVSDEVAPGLRELGVMLPYTPLHHLLLARGEVLVMTSGNLAGEPLCFDDEDARRRLASVADVFVTHDRPIAVPCEDSVVAWSPTDGLVPVRRSRGQVPVPVPVPGDRVVLAAGAEVKNTVALARDGLAFLSAHLGDLGTLEGRRAQDLAADQLVHFHRRVPELVVADAHPGYGSRAWAAQRAADLGVPLQLVQHHHAHLAALAAEHGRLDEPVLGLVLDGTGYGCDATVWGGEVLLLGERGASARRVGHLGDVPLPGGDAGVRHPVRTAAACLLAHGIDLDGTAVAAELTPAERGLLEGAAASRTGWASTSSAGRLFDVVSSLLGVRHRITYEAQAAVELEALAGSTDRVLDLELPVLPGGTVVLDPGPMLVALVDACRAGEEPAALARSFHDALARGLARAVDRVTATYDVGPVGLTGGVFANRLLLHLTRSRLEAAGHEVLVHRIVPPNDGGLSLGQVAVGLATITTTTTSARS